MLDLSVGAALSKTLAPDATAVKAVRNSLPGKLLGRTAAFLAGAVLVLGLADLAETRMVNLGLALSPAWLNPALLIGLPILVIAVQLLNEWQARRNCQKAVELAIKPALVPEDYFRIGPYLDSGEGHAAFARADQAHERVFGWLRQSSSVPLYLTGDSGSGKTSLLNAFVIPAFRKDGWTATVVRVGQDAEAALNDVLAAPRRQSVGSTTRQLIEAAAHRCHDRLLIVLDQFEEFLILATPERQSALATILADLNKRPIKGLKILLVVRSDYQTVLEEVGLPRLLQGENFFQVGRFREEAARTFFRNSKLGLKDEPLHRLLKSAAALDETPGMIRPITLNVLGYVLRQRGGAVASSLDAGALVRGYIAEAVENPAIRVWAPPVLEGLLTEQGTKRPREETELAVEAKLRTAEVRAVLHALAGAALARPLEATQSVWELSHDFVARAVSRYLGRRRVNRLRSAGAYAAPTLLVLGVVTGLAAFEWHRLAPGPAKAELADLGISVEPHGLYLSGTHANLEPLKGLTALQQLNLSGTHPNLEPLKDLTALQQLNLSDTPVADLEPLKGLTELQGLDLSYTPVANPEPLKGLTALQLLNLSGTAVANLEPLKGLTALQQLYLSDTPVANLEPLKGLTALQRLHLSGTHANLEPLKGLTALQELNLARTPVANLELLQGLTALQQLDLSGTHANLEPLKGLTALQELDLADTPVANLEPLKGLTALQRLNLSRTPVANLEPLKGLTALQQLNLAETRANLEPLNRTLTTF